MLGSQYAVVRSGVHQLHAHADVPNPNHKVEGGVPELLREGHLSHKLHVAVPADAPLLEVDSHADGGPVLLPYPGEDVGAGDAVVDESPEGEADEVVAVDVDVVADEGVAYADVDVGGGAQHPDLEGLPALLGDGGGAVDGREYAVGLGQLATFELVVVQEGVGLVQLHPEDVAVELVLLNHVGSPLLVVEAGRVPWVRVEAQDIHPVTAVEDYLLSVASFLLPLGLQHQSFQFGEVEAKVHHQLGHQLLKTSPTD